ncbi:hypothetical protein DFO80_12320 [Rhodobacter sp. 140A]|uniref:SAF domain-containing protein n=1 Tax=bioreactor metagenome TaxID=1076179 RepID=A0A644TJY3_9ZZZZ|nr:hypothetical protein DFO80_12320 [Rhodobacter sp. 140A]
MRLKVALLVTLGTILILVSSALLLVRVRAADQRAEEMNRAIAVFGDIVALPTLERDVKRGDEITAADLADLRIPSVYVPEGVLRAWPERSDPAQKYYALRDLKAHALLDAEEVWLGKADDGPLFAAGKGAVPITPKNLEEVAPALKVGDYVDVYWQRAATNGQPEVRQVATGLRVLGLPGVPAAPNAPKNAFNGRFVVEAGQDRIPVLLQAGAQGDLYVTVAGSSSTDDTGTVVVDNTVLRALPLVTRAGAAPAPIAAAVDRITEAQKGPQLCNLSVVRSSQRSVIQVPCN